MSGALGPLVLDMVFFMASIDMGPRNSRIYKEKYS